MRIPKLLLFYDSLKTGVSVGGNAGVGVGVSVGVKVGVGVGAVAFNFCVTFFILFNKLFILIAVLFLDQFGVTVVAFGRGQPGRRCGWIGGGCGFRS